MIQTGQIEEIDLLEGPGKVKIERKAVKTVDLFQAIGFIVSIIVGCGIFMTVGASYTVFASKNIFMVGLFWFIIGLLALGGGLSYAELGTRMPESGGERTYYRKILRPEFSVTFVYVYTFLVRILTISGLAVSTGEYMSSMLPVFNSYVVTAIAISTLVSCYIINCFSKKIVAKMGGGLSVIKLLAMALLIGIGTYYLAVTNKKSYRFTFKMEGFKFDNLILCILNCLFAYEGVNLIGFIAGDMINPVRDLPRAISISMILITVLYTLVAVSYALALGFNETRRSTNLATVVAKKAFGPAFYILPILVCCSTFGGALGNMYAVASASVPAALAGEIPKTFAWVDREQRTAFFTNLMVFSLSLIFIQFDFQTLLKYCAVLSWIFYFLSYVSLLKVKIATRKHNPKNIFQAPYPIVVLMLLVSFSVVIGCIYVELIASIILICITAVIFGVQFLPVPHKLLPPIRSAQDRALGWFSCHLNLERARIQDVS